MPPRLTRRAALKTMAAAALLPRLAVAQPASWRDRIRDYLSSLARPDGGFAWPGQERPHLTPTFAVIGGLRLLDALPGNKDTLATFVRTHHPAQLKKLEQEHHEFEWQQIQSLRWLGADASELRGRVTSWTKPYVYMQRYEKHGYPVFRSEMASFIGRELLGLPLSDLTPAYLHYLDERRRANGSFNNTPAADGSDGNVMNTWWGLQALRALGRGGEKRDETIAWLRACQSSSGGFLHQLKPAMGALAGAGYTWAAVRALKELGAAPAQRERCVAYLLSLQNEDGGFGERPGWASNPLSTYHALDALAALDALNEKTFATRPPKAPPMISVLRHLNVYSIQIEAHGKGSPAEAVDLAQSLRIHLWGAKNATPAWLARAQAIADEQRVPVKFFVANEEYGTFVHAPGFGTYSHTSDIIAPAGADIGPSLAKAGDVTWEQFRERRLAPLMKGGGRLVWQFGENEEMTRAYLDDSLLRGGYAAISTYHFGNPDFTNSEPFLMLYRGQIPYVALQDAHGPEPWWFADQTTGFRTLFLGTEPTWDAWLNALKHNWVAAVRHDAVSGYQTWMHAGSELVARCVRDRETEWRWWDNPAIQRPPVSIVIVRPEDEFEAARPETGIHVRVRTQWENTTQGLAKKEVTQLVSLKFNGQALETKLVQTGKPGAWTDVHHLGRLSGIKLGRNSVTATVRFVADGREVSRTIVKQNIP
ncbi:MAG: prenyltransferase/squalene oxidase repeat-containing protein [Verrucomicrobiota bacterium]